MSRLTHFLAKWLFPHLPGDVRRRKLNNLLTVLFVCLLVIGGIVLAMVWTENRNR